MALNNTIAHGDICSRIKITDLEDIFKDKKVQSTSELNILKDIITILAEKQYTSRKQYDKTIKKLLAKNKKLTKYPSKVTLNMLYKKLVASKMISQNKSLEKYMKRKYMKSSSGELPVTVFTSPSKFDCPNDCFYCPDEKKEQEFIHKKTGKKYTKKVRTQPRSYLSEEPGCRRATRNEFHPIRQTADRLHCLEIMGHEIDKVRFIVLGGTYCFYPLSYRIWFMTCLYYACNTYYSWKNNRPMGTLEEEMVINRTAQLTVSGIGVETRPDHCTLEDCAHFMHCGITTVQVGVQQLDDDILKGVNRGCTVQDIQDGTKRILDCGLKLDVHGMFDLPGPDKLCTLCPEQDKLMLDKLYNDERFSVADQLKLNPTATTPYTRILVWYKNMLAFMNNLKYKINIIKIQRTWRICKKYTYNGKKGGAQIDLSKKKYLPYSDIDNGSYLIDVIIYAKQNIHKDIRLNRIIRDIPGSIIVGGNKVSNLRQLVLLKMKQENLPPCKCIRCREIHGGDFNINELHLDIYTRKKAGSYEHFVSFEDKDGKLYGLARLRFLTNNSDCLPLLKNKAIIRELHVFGETVKRNSSTINKPQHSGLGKRLIEKCEELAINAGYTEICITSGEGVIKYYNKRGYKVVYSTYKGTKYHYMIKTLTKPYNIHYIIRYSIVITIVLSMLMQYFTYYSDF